MRYKILYTIITILFFTHCKNESSKSKYSDTSKMSNPTEHSASYTLAFLDTTIILRPIKNTTPSDRNLTEKEAEMVLYKYFKNKGVAKRSEVKRTSLSNEEKICVDYDTIYQIHTSKFSGAIISYWLGECDLNGHCFQPSKAIIIGTKSGYKISNEDFIPTNFTIDSSNGSGVYGYDFECGVRGVIRHFKLTLSE